MSNVVEIEPSVVKGGSLRTQTSETKKAGGLDFSDVMSSLNPIASTSVGISQGPRSASVTNAAISGLAVAPGAASGAYGGGTGPYFSPSLQVASSLGSGSYSYANVPGVGGTYTGASVGGGAGGINSVLSGTGGGPSQDFLEKEALFREMQDSQMGLLSLQAQLSNAANQVTLLSNTMKTRHDTDRGVINNTRAG